MITFTQTHNNKQFILINTDRNTNIDIIIKELKKQYPSLKQLHIVFDEAEIIIEINDNCEYGFSLNELREFIKPIAVAKVSQRYCGY